MVPLALLHSLTCCVHAYFEMSFFSICFASTLYLDPFKVLQLQLPVLFHSHESIQSVIVNEKLGIKAKTFN